MGASNIQLPDDPDWAGMRAEDDRRREEAEVRQIKLMNDIEDRRVEREQAEINRQQRVREQEENALQELERSITENSEAMTKFQKEEDKDIVIDFWKSLQVGSGQGKRPE